jgi:hypothetical protein
MRIVAGIALTLALAAPALAQDGNLYEQYDAAMEVFSPGGTAPGVITTALLDGLAGDWFPIGTLEPRENDAALFRTACEKAVSRITVRDAFSFDLTRSPGADGTITTTYSSRGWNAFGTYTDPVALLHWLGLDKEGTQPGLIERTLADYNGTATLHRPSPDVLVIQLNYGAPLIFGRCAE